MLNLEWGAVSRMYHAEGVSWDSGTTWDNQIQAYGGSAERANVYATK